MTSWAITSSDPSFGRNCPPRPPSVPAGQPGCFGSSGLALKISRECKANPHAAAAFVACVFNENVGRFHRVARALVGQVGDAQMHRGYPCQGFIVRVQGGSDRRKSRHEPIYVQRRPIGAPEQRCEFVSFAHDKAAVATLDQWRAAKQQALLGAGEAEILVTAVFTKTPDFENHFRPVMGDL